ncbi:MAG: protein phosphatase [Thermoleophilia bacterium]
MLTLPDGTTLRGRGLRAPAPAGPPPDWALHLLGRPPDAAPWPVRWVRWPDFRLPADDRDARAAFAEAHARAAAGERVEVACAGGRGRTGTALACIAQLAGVPGDEAVAWVRARFHPRAVETPWQRRYVRRFDRG